MQCTACAYKWKIIDTDSDSECDPCPLDFSHVLEEYPELERISTHCLGGLFRMWEFLTDLVNEDDDNVRDEIIVIIETLPGGKDNIRELCSKYARAIMNLEPKKGVKYE